MNFGIRPAPNATKPGWLARPSLVELVRSVLFRRPVPECQNLVGAYPGDFVSAKSRSLNSC
jgi:hypothetical protein